MLKLLINVASLKLIKRKKKIIEEEEVEDSRLNKQ